jgi:hypothetical protein
MGLLMVNSEVSDFRALLMIITKVSDFMGLLMIISEVLLLAMFVPDIVTGIPNILQSQERIPVPNKC